MKNEVIERIRDYGLTRMKDGVGIGELGCELHHHLYNMDYYIIGTYQAKQELEEYGTFDAIEKVQEYEMDNFGEVYTELSNTEKLVNMLAYIIGEEFLMESEVLQDKWDVSLTEDDVQAIIEELEDVE